MVPDRPGKLHEGARRDRQAGGTRLATGPLSFPLTRHRRPSPAIPRNGKQVSWLLTLMPNLTR